MKKHPIFFQILKLFASSKFNFFFICLSCPLLAQNITNETNLFIPEGLAIRIDGNLNNAGLFQNNGTFALTGNWLNTFVYQGNGKVELYGINQNLNNRDQAIHHLTLNGGGVKSLQGLLTITGKIDFNEGIMLVSDTDTLLLDEACIVNAGSASSYVDGALTAAGSGYKFFPIGKNGKYHPVEFLNSIGINTLQSLEVFENLPAVETSFPTVIQRDIYWERKTNSGSFVSSPIALGYDLSGLNLGRVIIVEGETTGAMFSVLENVDINTSADPNIISSELPATKNIFAVGELLVDPPKEYYLSTTLSPNADNPDNRRIKVFGDNLTPAGFSFQVFNRWGLLIFETDSFDKMTTQGWDGAQNGNIVPSGVYPYSIKFVDTAGRSNQRTGFVTVLH